MSPDGNLPLYVALVGSAIAGYVDLRTTEIPDEIPAAMAMFAVLWGGLSYLTAGSYMLVSSLLVGTMFFTLGFVMYYTGQWGGGDAKLLAGIGMLVPQAPAFASQSVFPFALSYLLNVFMLGAVYIISYTMIIAVPNKTITHAFIHDIRGGWKQIGFFGATLFVILFATVYLVGGVLSSRTVFLSLALVPGGIAMFVLWRFLRIVERVGFQKKISTSKLRPGDMLGEDVPGLRLSKKLIRGLTEQEVRNIKKHQKTIMIREGVRFGPVFMLAMLYTILYGDVVTLFMLF